MFVSPLPCEHLIQSFHKQHPFSSKLDPQLHLFNKQAQLCRPKEASAYRRLIQRHPRRRCTTVSHSFKHQLPAGQHFRRREVHLCSSASSRSRGHKIQGIAASKRNGHAESPLTHDPVAKSAERVKRLKILVQLRKLYRNLLRAERLLATSSPVHQKPADVKPVKGKKSKQPPLLEDNGEEQEMLEAAVEVVAEMQLTAEELKVGLRRLVTGEKDFSHVFQREDQPNVQEQVVARANKYSKRLVERAEKELDLLPFSSHAAAQAALDARNARFRNVSSRSRDLDDEDSSNRVEKAEKRVGEFVARRLSPAVQRVRKTPVRRWLSGVRSGAGYVGGLWARLNGTARRESMANCLPEGLPYPSSTREQSSGVLHALRVEIDALEKKLQDSSKLRESRLRKAGIAGRARMASELRDMDEDVSSLSRTLAVRTLQLEMEYIYSCLEDETLDIAQDLKGAGYLLLRQGSSDEVALLVAEFGLLDQQLANLAAAIEQSQAILITEDELIPVASEIPDMLTRLGIAEGLVFGGQGITWIKVRLKIRETVGKVTEGVQFFTRGIRLLGSDCNNCGRLFYRAALGQTLKPREVQALRRTAWDVLIFVPFTIILIAPLTPVGHVLIFGFIQRYFPGFFPSQFSTRRQELMTRYEDLKQQLMAAQNLAEQEGDQQELARAAAAVARLTFPASGPADMPQRPALATQEASLRSGSNGDKVSWDGSYDDDAEGPAAKALRSLEQQVQAAEDDTLRGTIDEGGDSPMESAAR
ncbi:hypothetical protein ABBQ32_008692 [Trebouxia sp. C0010 RCD-2024]